jgi:hypothetical protein
LHSDKGIAPPPAGSETLRPGKLLLGRNQLPADRPARARPAPPRSCRPRARRGAVTLRQPRAAPARDLTACRRCRRPRRVRAAAPRPADPAPPRRSLSARLPQRCPWSSSSFCLACFRDRPSGSRDASHFHPGIPADLPLRPTCASFCDDVCASFCDDASPVEHDKRRRR